MLMYSIWTTINPRARYLDDGSSVAGDTGPEIGALLVAPRVGALVVGHAEDEVAEEVADREDAA